MTVGLKQKDSCDDEEYNSDDENDDEVDGSDSNDKDGECDEPCTQPDDEEEPCTLPDEEEPPEGEEQERECDFSVEISDGVNSEGSGQEESCVTASDGNSYYKIVGDNIDKNIRPSFQRVSHQTKSLHYFHSYAAMDRVNFSNLSNDVPHSIEVDCDCLLPGKDDLTTFLQELKILVSRQVLLILHCCICFGNV